MAPLRRLLAALALLPLLACAEREPPRAIFLLVVDTLRADHVSSYGEERAATPHIDGLAARGTRFARAQAASSWTVPSMAALFTSRWPRELGLLERPVSGPVERFALREQGNLSLHPEAPALAALLRAQGWRTAGFVDQPMLDHHSGFARGFDDWFHVVGRGDARRFDPESDAPPARWEDTPHAFENDAALVARFDAWLAGASPDAKLFAWLHLLTPHTPYLPPPEFAGEGGGPVSPQAYAGEVRAADALVGRALAAIERHVGADRAWILLTSDHGESLGDHGELGHGQTLHAEVMQVPLVLAGPGIEAGRVVESPVRLLDVAPTLLALAGAEAPTSFRGASLLEEGVPRPALAEGMLYGPSEQALVVDGYKLLRDAPAAPPKLFADGDESERHDLAAREAATLRRLVAALDALRAAADRDAVAGGDAMPSARDREALQALGYVEPAAPE